MNPIVYGAILVACVVGLYVVLSYALATFQ